MLFGFGSPISSKGLINYSVFFNITFLGKTLKKVGTKISALIHSYLKSSVQMWGHSQTT